MVRAAVPCRCRFPASEMARRFYLSEAESLLPQVSAWIQEAVFLKSECQEAENNLESTCLILLTSFWGPPPAWLVALQALPEMQPVW